MNKTDTISVIYKRANSCHDSKTSENTVVSKQNVITNVIMTSLTDKKILVFVLFTHVRKTAECRIHSYIF